MHPRDGCNDDTITKDDDCSQKNLDALDDKGVRRGGLVSRGIGAVGQRGIEVSAVPRPGQVAITLRHCLLQKRQMDLVSVLYSFLLLYLYIWQYMVI